MLCDEIELIRENYIINYKSLHHQGDEALVSSAIEKVMQKKYICNAGLFGGIGRYWSVKPLHAQNHWKPCVNNFLLHLPADKNIIATISFIYDQFFKKYENYLLKKNRITPMMFKKK